MKTTNSLGPRLTPLESLNARNPGNYVASGSGNGKDKVRWIMERQSSMVGVSVEGTSGLLPHEKLKAELELSDSEGNLEPTTPLNLSERDEEDEDVESEVEPEEDPEEEPEEDPEE
uniref:Uncharacterized protein n=1 Tax=Lactuca sativa TaxID=4236 RepID=A0A9R1VZ01_LACSA|nr:hypothetical protein LSAT_V11C300132060 [Lactuca sativa]